jgi:Putative metallopeptidase
MESLSRNSLAFIAAAAGLVFSQLAATQPALSQSATAPAKAYPNRVKIEYLDPKSDEFKETAALLKQVRGLEGMQELLGPFVLPEDLTLRAKECGFVNAWYNREDGKPTVTICYDMLADYIKKLPKETTAEGITRQDAAAGQFFWLVTHETGHAMFDIFHMPIMGHEENAADNFATYMMLHFGKERARRLINGSAWSYHAYVSDDQSKRLTKMYTIGFASPHAQPEERFYNQLCLAYGADPVTFAGLVKDDWLPESRAKTCRDDFQTLAFAMRTLITPHIDQDLAKPIHDIQWLPANTPAPQVTRAATEAAKPAK